MIRISRNNYEPFLLDYLEGRLSAEDQAAVILFLEANPDIREELEGLEESVLVEDEVVSDWSLLKKDIHSDIPGVKRQDRLFIADLEGDITPAEKAELKALLADRPGLEREAVFFRSSVLEPDLSEKLDDTSFLKKDGGRVIPLWVRVSAAAGIALLAGVPFFFSGEDRSPMAYLPRTAFFETVATDEPDATTYRHLTKGATDPKDMQATVKTEGQKNERSEYRSNLFTPPSGDQLAGIIQSLPAKSVMNEADASLLALGAVPPAPAVKADPTEAPSEEFLKPGEFVHRAIMNRTEENFTVKGGKKKQNLSGDDLLALSARAVSRITRRKTVFEKTYDDRGSLAQVKVKIGKVEFSRK